MTGLLGFGKFNSLFFYLMANVSLTDARDSRFVQRWLQGAEGRAQQLAELAKLSLSNADFTRLLQNEMHTGLGLPGAMRRVRNLVMACIIERDLRGLADLHEVVSTISGFADFVIQTHLAALHAELAAQHGEPIGEESGRPQYLMVVGMGKLGGHELNVSSDIDLIFIYNEDGETRASGEQRGLSNHEFFARLGKRLIADISAVTEDGFSFRVDMALRPNGNSGPLVASLNMLEQYLMAQGREWERYAWVKARAVTGEAEDIAQLEAVVRPFVYRRYLDFGAIHALRDMHGQIRAEVKRQESRHPERSNNVKLGRGGIREIEFLAQVFQLIRGGRDAELRDRSTRTTLAVLARKALLAPEVVEQLLQAYGFLRKLEHRLQYLDDAQTHVVPARADDVELLGRMMGMKSGDEMLAALAQQRSFVAGQFDEMFSDKQASDEDSAQSGAQQAPPLQDDDSEDSVSARLEGLGYEDAAGLARRLHAGLHSPRLRALSSASRERLLQLVNTAIVNIAALPDGRPATLLRLLDFFETIARRAAYLALLTEYPQALARVVRMMHASDWAAKYLTQHPLLLDELLDERHLQEVPDWKAFADECQAQLDAASGDTERQMDILREVHHAALLRLLAQDLDGRLSVERLADHLSALADVLVAATLRAAWESIPKRHSEVPQFAVIAYGKLGGKELGYASDLDLVFLYDDEDPEAPGLYAKLAQRFITWMTTHTPAGILFDVDMALRPDGASGLMVTPVTSFEKYQRQSAWVWEHQALTRARYCAGDAGIGERFEALRAAVLCQPREQDALQSEILSMRRRMHEAHPNRSGQFDLKHDAGGMIDIEFMVQYLVLLHACRHAQLAGDIGNIALLKVCGELGLIDAGLALATADAYRIFRRMQHQIRLQGADKARVDPSRVETAAGQVRALWAEVFAGP
jgi:glutamate-ammonia-ligase adenylyltransferase